MTSEAQIVEGHRLAVAGQEPTIARDVGAEVVPPLLRDQADRPGR
ncbi:MAG TPA: hypothetical protein VI248_12515 [Kineosporiaceae bacterium]